MNQDREKQNDKNIEVTANLDDNTQHIRPLAVRPLNNYERVPNPWGFFVPILLAPALYEAGRQS